MSEKTPLDVNVNKSETSRTESVAEYPIKKAISDYFQNLESVFNGVLSTFAHENSQAAGYPFASIVPFVLDKDGNPIIMAAEISQHYLNMKANPKVSLFLQQPFKKRANVQTQWRMTLTGVVEEVDKESEGPQNYFRHYPASKSYSEFHDFKFLKIKKDMIHIVQNFGQIAWLDSIDVEDPCPMEASELDYAIEHMNEDHVDSLYTYLQNAGHSVDGARKIELVSLNHRRFVIRHQNILHSIQFPTRVNNSTELRQAMIKMAYPI